MKLCVLDDEKPCDGCGECQRCELDPNKLCDNCMRCVNSEGAEYRAIKITGIEVSEKALPAGKDGAK